MNCLAKMYSALYQPVLLKKIHSGIRKKSDSWYICIRKQLISKHMCLINIILKESIRIKRLLK